MRAHLIRAALALTTALVGHAATAQDRWDWRPGGYALRGAGVPLLAPELRDSPRGRAFVMRNFDWNRDGFVQPREAIAANRAFIDVAGPGYDPARGGFDWERHGLAPYAAADRGGWDRGAMRGLGFRQTSRGATLDLSADVLFATDSATLRPGALAKLRPLVDYLRDTPGVRVAVDGYTDARGSDAQNQALSERRAASVRDAIVAMGADRARFVVTGHGEGDPIASNATADGMRQNRRVDVTLLGRRVSEFGE